VASLNITELPDGSNLSVRQRRGGVVEVNFTPPSGLGLRFAILSALAIIWWLLWVFSFIVVIAMIVALIRGTEADSTGQLLGTVFVFIWLGGWGYGGMVLLRAIYHTLKGTEHIVLEPDLLCYRSGKSEDEPPPWRFWTGGVRVPRHSVGAVRIEDTTEGRHVILTSGSQRVAIGQHLDGKDARWLGDLLGRWRGVVER
jgi:hypothetical protein